MQEDNRKRQEICRALHGELEQLLRVVYQHKTKPIELKTPVYDKFEVEFWQLPDELTQNIRKLHSKFVEANRLLNSTDTIETMIRSDLWYTYLPNDITVLQEELKKYEATLTTDMSNEVPTSLSKALGMNITQMEWDLFICHATEDKNEVARPLAETLRSKGLKVWYDDFTLTIGDSLRRSIDKGLARSRYGVVILSPYFFRKDWPQKELDGLTARERNGIKVILPVWHQVDKEFVLRYSPTLADRVAARMDKGIDQVVGEIVRAISIDRPTEDAQAEGSSSKENAKQLLRRQASMIPELKAKSCYPPEFEPWRQQTIRIIRKIFGGSSGQAQEFESISFGLIVSSTSTPDSAWQGAYEEGLSVAEISLRSFVDELDLL